MTDDLRAAAEALFKPGLQRRTRRNGSIHDREPALNCVKLAAELRRIESMAARLTVWRNDPERFHVDKGELKAAIGALAKQLEGR